MRFATGDKCSYYCEDDDQTYTFTIKEIFEGYHPSQTGWEGTDWCIPVEDMPQFPAFCLENIKLVQKNTKSYFLVYSEGCTPKIKEFRNEKDLHKFMAEFSLDMYDNPDNWIDYVFQGDIIMKSKEFRLESVK